MKPVIVSVDVAASPAQAFEHLDTLANHEAFLDHYLEKWKFSGPTSGLGAKAEALAKAPGSQDWFEFEVVEREAPRLLVEDGVSAGGKRRTRGIYRLSEAGGGTRIEFTLEFLEAAALRAPRPVPDSRFCQAGQRQGAAAPRQAARRLKGSSRGRGGARRPGGAAGAAGADRGRGAARRGRAAPRRRRAHRAGEPRRPGRPRLLRRVRALRDRRPARPPRARRT